MEVGAPEVDGVALVGAVVVFAATIAVRATHPGGIRATLNAMPAVGTEQSFLAEPHGVLTHRAAECAWDRVAGLRRTPSYIPRGRAVALVHGVVGG